MSQYRVVSNFNSVNDLVYNCYMIWYTIMTKNLTVTENVSLDFTYSGIHAVYKKTGT